MKNSVEVKKYIAVLGIIFIELLWLSGGVVSVLQQPDQISFSFENNVILERTVSPPFFFQKEFIMFLFIILQIQLLPVNCL